MGMGLHVQATRTMKHRWKYPMAFTGIPSRLIDSDLCRMSGNEVKVYVAIARFTWGRGKHYDTIAGTQLRKVTGLSARALYYALAGLKERGHISVTGAARSPKRFELMVGNGRKEWLECSIIETRR